MTATIPGTPGRFYYVRKEGLVHLTHVHVCAVGHLEIAKMLCFRDYLRAHPEETERYAKLKVERGVRAQYLRGAAHPIVRRAPREPRTSCR